MEVVVNCCFRRRFPGGRTLIVVDLCSKGAGGARRVVKIIIETGWHPGSINPEPERVDKPPAAVEETYSIPVVVPRSGVECIKVGRGLAAGIKKTAGYQLAQLVRWSRP